MAHGGDRAQSAAEHQHPAAVFGLGLVILGTVVNVAGRLALGKNWGNQVIIYDDHKLVTNGSYRFVRHPLYAGLIWMFAGAALVFQNWAALAGTILVFFPAMHYRAKQEEQALVAQFPEYVASKLFACMKNGGCCALTRLD